MKKPLRNLEPLHIHGEMVVASLLILRAIVFSLQ